MIRNNEFNNIRNKFVDHLNNDTENMQSSKIGLVFIDKNTKKRAPKNAKRNVDRKSKSFAKTLKIEYRMECYSDEHEYMTLKDHIRILERTLNAD